MQIKRELLQGGVIRLSAGECSFVFERLRPAVLQVTITGRDDGQFGTSTLDEIYTAINREGRIELFVDAGSATGASINVSEDWTRFFDQNREKFSRVHVLVSSKVVHLTVSIAQHLSRTGNLIQIYSDPDLFAGKLEGVR